MKDLEETLLSAPLAAPSRPHELQMEAMFSSAWAAARRPARVRTQVWWAVAWGLCGMASVLTVGRLSPAQRAAPTVYRLEATSPMRSFLGDSPADSTLLPHFETRVIAPPSS